MVFGEKEIRMTTMTITEKRTETASHILEVAKDVFAEQGFAGARVDEIARRAGVNKATLYYQIGDKKALYAEVIHNVLSNAAELGARAIEKAQTPEEKLRCYVRSIARTMDENPQMPPLMMREVASGGKNFPAEAARDLVQIVEILTTVLKEGHEKGVFIETTPFLIHMMVMGVIVLYKLSAPIRTNQPAIPKTIKKLDKNVSGAIAEEIEKLILRAVLKEVPRK
jgi:AcrR family transcriptional regulator